MRLRNAWSRLWAKTRCENELNDEMQYHLDRQIEANLAAGMSREEARRDALCLFGGIDSVKEQCREVRNTRFLHGLMQDLRYGLLQLRRNPGFFAVALITLALCIGANTAIFTVVNAVLWRPLPYPHGDRLVQMQGFHSGMREPTSVAPLLFEGWRGNLREFKQIAAFHSFDTFILNAEPAERLRVLRASPGFFEILGARPSAGRIFLPDEEKPGRDAVVILSHELWARRFQSDPSIINRTITLNGSSYTVIGIMSEGFRYWGIYDCWVPFGPALESERSKLSYLRVIGRLVDGTSVERARAEVDSVTSALRRRYPGMELGAHITPERDYLVAESRPALLLLFGSVIFVLLIGCSNVANLFFARGMARQKEIAVRMALGAGRMRLFRQLLTESLLLAAFGGCLGFLLSRWGVRMLLALKTGLPRTSEISADGWVLLFNAGISLLAGIVFGCLPAFRTSALELTGGLKEGRGVSPGTGRRSIRNALIVFEIALTVVLLIGAGLLIRSFLRLKAVDPGFNTSSVLAFQVAARGANTSAAGVSRQKRAAAGEFYQEVVKRVAAIPGVIASGGINELPFGEGRTSYSFEIEGRPSANSPVAIADVCTVSSDYFRAMGIPLMSGRVFTEFDIAGSAKVAMINQEMARRYWPDNSPLHKRIITGSPAEHFEIVGVVGNILNSRLNSDYPLEIYTPWDFQQIRPMRRWAGEMYVVVRTTGDPAALIPAIRATVQDIDKGQPIYGIRIMKQALERTISNDRSNMLLLSIFAGLALVLASIGIYGVIAYLVEQRTQEIGVRMALGARRSDVTIMLLKQAAIMASAGFAIGALIALATNRLLKNMLFGIASNDWRTFLSVAVIVGVAALAATLVPARGATRVDPILAIRGE